MPPTAFWGYDADISGICRSSGAHTGESSVFEHRTVLKIEDRFCSSRKGGTGGSGWVQTAWLHLGPAAEMTWLALGGPLMSFLA